MKAHLYATLGIALLCAGYSVAQTPGNPPIGGKSDNRSEDGNTTVLKTTTRLVQFDLIVEDRRGKPVESLTPDDLTLFDNGKAQKIALFTRNTDKAIQNSADNERVGAERDLDVYRNRKQGPDQPANSVTVVLFDALNTSPGDQSYARAELLKFLRQLQPEDHVAIYLLTNKLRVINEFTQDSKALLAAVARLQSSTSLYLEDSTQPYTTSADTGITDTKGARHLASAINDMNSKMSDISNANRMRITANAIEAIANHVMGVPGRKNLVWVSGSFPVSISFRSNDNSPVSSESQNFTPALERVARALNQSNMAIYPVDARGILTASELDVSVAHPFAHDAPEGDAGAAQDEQKDDGPAGGPHWGTRVPQHE